MQLSTEKLSQILLHPLPGTRPLSQPVGQSVSQSASNEQLTVPTPTLPPHWANDDPNATLVGNLFTSCRNLHHNKIQQRLIQVVFPNTSHNLTRYTQVTDRDRRQQEVSCRIALLWHTYLHTYTKKIIDRMNSSYSQRRA